MPDSLKMIHGELLSFLSMFSVLRLENTGMNFDRVQCREVERQHMLNLCDNTTGKCVIAEGSARPSYLKSHALI